ncbi:hypothetical protein N7520_009538 [Penicillium odoratum]|uniref:uncharacterized protein n=1 Tax=Penicillium odoratum TaxID=1167516 RepID=UPI002547104D|nr:uncharacterized protein N7520_009538 [Penicillium odoratum]KAJ5752621.1 hypothetical protein N7520_009538 [Penicillium odoratum]
MIVLREKDAAQGVVGVVLLAIKGQGGSQLSGIALWSATVASNLGRLNSTVISGCVFERHFLWTRKIQKDMGIE